MLEGMRRNVALSLVAVAACGPSVEENEEEVVVVPHREAPCRVVCESMLDRECGNTEHPNFPMFDSVDACVDQCGGEGYGWHWAPQEDGKDACIEPWGAYSACLGSLSCEQQHESWVASPTSEYPCKTELHAYVSCGQDNNILVEEE